MDNIGEYIWVISAIILTFASLFKSVGKRKQQRKKTLRGAETRNEADMPFDRTFEELRKSIAEAAKRSEQSQQPIMRHSTDIQPALSHSTKRTITTTISGNTQFETPRQFPASATTKTPKAVKTTAKKQVERPKSTKSTAAELVKNSELGGQFNLRDAIVYSEIMKPKFED